MYVFIALKDQKSADEPFQALDFAIDAYSIAGFAKSTLARHVPDFASPRVKNPSTGCPHQAHNSP